MDSLQEKLLQVYYDKINEKAPKAIERLDFVNAIITYMYELYNDLNIENIVNRNIKRVLSKDEINKICIQILRSIDPMYSINFHAFLKTDMITPSKENYSCADEEGIHIFQTNNIEQIITTIHEFAHHLHRINLCLEDELSTDPDAWYSCEMIAMTFEFYALFYMYKNDILADEIKKSFLSYIYFIYNKLSKVMGEALMLNIIDKYTFLSVDCILKYKKKYKVSDEQLRKIYGIDHSKLVRYLKGDESEIVNEYRYPDEYRYIFGFPLSIYIANRMVNSNSYKARFVENFTNIDILGSDKFLKKMSAYQIIEDPDCLEWIIENVKSYINHIINDNEFNPKMIRFKR